MRNAFCWDCLAFTWSVHIIDWVVTKHNDILESCENETCCIYRCILLSKANVMPPLFP